MPLVSATLTHRQWHEWDQKYNIAPKSLSVLAEEGIWLLDGLDEQRRRVVLHEVPLLRGSSCSMSSARANRPILHRHFGSHPRPVRDPSSCTG